MAAEPKRFNLAKPYRQFKCARENDCGLVFTLQPHGEDMPTTEPRPIWCVRCGDMLPVAEPSVQLGLFV